MDKSAVEHAPHEFPCVVLFAGHDTLSGEGVLTAVW